MTWTKTGRLHALLGLAVVLVLGTAQRAHAEVFQLLDNSKLAGKLLHYYEGVFHIEQAGGERIELPRDKVKSISFELPAPRPELSTPEKTFRRWYDAVTRGDLHTVVDCYALIYQGLVSAQLGQSDDELKKMQKDLDGTRVDVKGSKIAGSSATLKVQKSRGDDLATAEIRLVLENGEWKMTP